MWSDLTSTVLVSPNCSSREGRKIERITVHHAAGLCTVEGLLNEFVTPWQEGGRQASANYVIGNDGRIGGCVPEELRAWTSGSKDNDTRAITIEVSNDVNGEPWSIGSRAWNSAVNLCADICMRYGFRLKWHPLIKAGTLTCHRWYQDTICPGNWFYERIPDFIKEVNGMLDELNQLKKTVDEQAQTISALTSRLNAVEQYDKKVDAEITKLDERTKAKYHEVDDCPEYAQATIQKLVDRGALVGVKAGDLGLTDDLTRNLVITDRCGGFD